eukprot:2539363-Amphidinium_carterae.3
MEDCGLQKWSGGGEKAGQAADTRCPAPQTLTTGALEEVALTLSLHFNRKGGLWAGRWCSTPPTHNTQMEDGGQDNDSQVQK